MSTQTLNPVSGILGQMHQSGISIDVAMQFHRFMRRNQEHHKTRKAVRVVLQNIRKNFNATH